MRDVEAFDPAGNFGNVQGILERFTNGLRRGPHHPEPGVKAVLGIRLDQAQECLLAAALRRRDLNSLASKLRQIIFEFIPVFEIDRDMDRSGNIVVAQIDLLQ